MRVASFVWLVFTVLFMIYGSAYEDQFYVVVLIVVVCAAMSTLCLGIQMILLAIERLDREY